MVASLNVRHVQISKQTAKDCPDIELVVSLLNCEKCFIFLVTQQELEGSKVDSVITRIKSGWSKFCNYTNLSFNHPITPGTFCRSSFNLYNL